MCRLTRIEGSSFAKIHIERDNLLSTDDGEGRASEPIDDKGCVCASVSDMEVRGRQSPPGRDRTPG